MALLARAHPAWGPAGTLSASQYRACLDALWASLADGDQPPSCVTADHARHTEAAAESDDAPRLAFVAADGVAALWYARRAVDDPDAAVHPARRVAAAVDSLVQELLGPRPVPTPPATVSEDRRLWVERQEAIAAHELARLAHTALRDAAALTKGAEPASLREPAQRTGQAVAVWTAELLQRPRREVGLGESLPATPHPGAAGGGRGGGAAR